MSNIFKLGAEEIVRSIKNQEITAEEYVHSLINRIHEMECKIHAYISYSRDAIEKARVIDSKIKKGKPVGKLAGIAIAVKDNISTRGTQTTCGSRMLEKYVPPYNATVIDKILAEDAIIIGKTNMDEFGMGSSTETSYFGPTHNPWDLSRIPGGSSGGSAAALIANEASVALGSDTGGSIRCPASYCSIVGLKPTYGSVSRYGLISYANSLEQIGPMARHVSDCALLLESIRGLDTRDNTSINSPEILSLKKSEYDIRKTRIGIPLEFLGQGVDECVKKEVWNAVHCLEDLGAKYEKISLPSMKYALAAYYIIAMSEASSNLARYDGIRYGSQINQEDLDLSTYYSLTRKRGFGPEVRRRIILGTYALTAGYFSRYYLKSLKIRTLIIKDLERAFKKFDVLIGPTMPVKPFKLGEKIGDPLALYMSDILTVPANLSGCPSISVPCGLSEGLPIGMQIIGNLLEENKMLHIAHVYEREVKFCFKIPP